MAFSEDLVTFLKAQSSITDLVGSGAAARIRPAKLKQREAVPAIRYVIPSAESAEGLSGPVGVCSPNLQIDCYGRTKKLANELGEAVRLSLQGFRGMMGSTFVNSITLPNQMELYEEPIDSSDEGVHRKMLQFLVFHSEATA